MFYYSTQERVHLIDKTVGLRRPSFLGPGHSLEAGETEQKYPSLDESNKVSRSGGKRFWTALVIEGLLSRSFLLALLILALSVLCPGDSLTAILFTRMSSSHLRGESGWEVNRIDHSSSKRSTG